VSIKSLLDCDKADISSRRRRCFKRMTTRKAAHPMAPNRLNQQSEAARPDQVWLVDITYVPTTEAG
jgi:putative transposase